MSAPIINNGLHLLGKKRKELAFPSRRTSNEVICHNTLELDFCLLLEHDPMVVGYCSQPEALVVDVGGHQHRYQPHFRVETSEMTFYADIRPDYAPLCMRVKRMLMSAVEMLQINHSALELYDHDDIRDAGAKLTNLRFLYFRSFHVSPTELAQFIGVLPSLKFPMPLHKLCEDLTDIPDKIICHAMFYQILDFDISQPLSRDTCFFGYSLRN